MPYFSWRVLMGGCNGNWLPCVRTIGTMEHITGMMQNGKTEHARRNQNMLIGPWGHTTAFILLGNGLRDWLDPRRRRS